jgi:hypothetical protein
VVKNSTNINKASNNLSLQIGDHKKRQLYIKLEIHVLALEQAQKYDEVKSVNGMPM